MDVCPGDGSRDGSLEAVPWIQRREKERRGDLETKLRSSSEPRHLHLTEGPWVITLKIHAWSYYFKPLRQTVL